MTTKVQLLDQSSKAKKNLKRYASISGLVTGVGGFLYLVFPMILDAGIKTQMVLEEGNIMYKNWENIPFATTVKVHIWSIENPEDFANGKKAKLREMGPYVYNQYRWKEGISWSNNKEIVRYWELRSFYFDSKRSNGSLNDKITVINTPIYAMAAVIKGLIDELPLSFAIAPFVYGILNVIFISHTEGLLIDLTVGQLLNGYKFKLLDTFDTVTKPLKWFGIELPDTGMPENQFGLFSVKNFTKTGPIEVYTGQGKTKDKFLKYASWANKKALDFYNNPKCNMMNGTDGTVMGTFLKKNNPIYVFVPDACKSFHAVYKEMSSVREIPTWRYVLPQTLFARPDINPSNKCFCREKKYAKCDGIFDLGPCQKGVPFAVSFPHFMYASSTIRKGVDGVSEPDPQIHESFFDVEPTTGVPLKAAGRIQVNFLMKRMPLIAGFGGFKETVLPFIWIEESAEIDDNMGTLLKLAIYPIRAIDITGAVATLSGLGLLAAAAGYGIKNRKLIMSSSESEQNEQNYKETLKKEFDILPVRRLTPPSKPMIRTDSRPQIKQNNLKNKPNEYNVMENYHSNNTMGINQNPLLPKNGNDSVEIIRPRTNVIMNDNGTSMSSIITLNAPELVQNQLLSSISQSIPIRDPKLYPSLPLSQSISIPDPNSFPTESISSESQQIYTIQQQSPFIKENPMQQLTMDLKEIAELKDVSNMTIKSIVKMDKTTSPHGSPPLDDLIAHNPAYREEHNYI